MAVTAIAETTETTNIEVKDPFVVLVEQEKAITNHDEWIDVHNAGLLDLFVSNQITREQYLQRIGEERRELEAQALVDPLTGIWNRRGLNKEIQSQTEEAKRLARETGKLSGSAMFLDVDSFKLINDSYGHDFGDEILKTYARVLQTNLRPGDTVGRLGGDEFVVFLKEAEESQAKEVADRIRQEIIKAVRQQFLDAGINQSREQTISAGISQLKNGDDIKSLLARADLALDYAKKSGKNQALIFEDDKMGLKTKGITAPVEQAAGLH